MYFFKLIASLSLTLVFSSSLASEDMEEYDSAGWWSIRIDTSLNDGCFVYAAYEGGTEFRMGIDNSDTDSKSLYALVGDPGWESIEYGKEYDIKIQFGNEEKWSGSARGMSFDPPKNAPYLRIEISDEKDTSALFIEEFMQESWVEIFYNGSSITKLQLKDSYAAGLKLAECQRDMNEETRDPFSRPRKSSDPFAA